MRMKTGSHSLLILLCKQSVFLLLLIFPLLYYAQNNYWLRRAGSVGMDEAMDMAKDSSGNIYVVGYFTGNCAFQYNPSVVLTSSGADDVFIAKYSASGILLWAVKAGGVLSDRAKSVAVTPGGDVFVTGEYRGTSVFGPFTLSSNANSPDVFTARLNTNGVFQWVRSGGGAGIEVTNGIAVDTAGNSVITGQFINTCVFGAFSATSMINPQTNTPSYDIFIVRYDAQGNEMWLKHGAAKYADRGMSIGMDLASNAYVVIQYSDTLTFTNTYNNVSYNAMGVMKLDAQGNEMWFSKAAGSSMLQGNDIHVDKNGSTYITGDFKSSIYFYGTPNVFLQANYANNIFICRYNPAGQILWAKGSGSENEVTSRAITLDNWNDIYITGYFKCTMTEFSDYYGGTGLFNSVGFNDVFIAKYKFAQGAFQYARQFGSKMNDYARGIVINTMNKPYICGSHEKAFNVPANHANGWSYHDNNNSQNLFWLNTNNNNLNYINNLVPQSTPYCNDAAYNNYLCLRNNGNADMFIGNFLDTTRAPYDYYYRTGQACNRDYVPGGTNGQYPPIHTTPYPDKKPPINDFNFAGDTVLICDTGTVWAVTRTSSYGDYLKYFSNGPAFDYLWNTGDTTRYLHLNTAGYYSVTATTKDGCYTFSDTIYADVTPYPQPIVSDDYIVHTNWPYDYKIGICGPDTITLTGGNYTGNTYNWTGTGLPQNGLVDTSIVVTDNGIFQWNLITPKGCKKSLEVEVVIDTIPPQLPPYAPKMVFSPNPVNDTIKYCYGQGFSWVMMDTLTNTCMKYCSSTGSFLNGNPYNVNSGPNQCYGAYLAPSVSGWYIFDMNFKKDTVNYCGKDSAFYSVKDSVYVIVHPLPSASVTITGNVLLCPGDTGVLYANGTGNYTWSGPSPVYMIGDSIAYIVSPGTYTVTTTVIDSNGCSKTASAFITIQLKTATLNSLPNPALICPNDSVQLIAPPGLTYDWYGPYGYMATTTQNTFWVSNPGMYYVIMIDNDSCELVSNMLEVKQYTTPDLVVLPWNIICPGDSAQLLVVASPGATVLWLPPLSGGGLSKYVTQSGTYSCQVTSCGIVTTLSVTITVSTPLAQISPQGSSTICPGDSVLFIANLGMLAYNWTPGGSTMPFLWASDSGQYILQTINNDGCVAFDTIYISIDSIAPPLVNDTTICYGSTVTLQAFAPTGTIMWYEDSLGNNLLGTGNLFTTGVLYSDTVYYVSVVDSCESFLLPVWVFIDTASLVPNIYVNNPTCVGGFLTFTAPFYNNGQYFWTGPNGFTSNAQTFTLNNVTLQDSGLYTLTLIANTCTSMVGSVNIIILDSLPAISVYTNAPVCEGDTLFLQTDTVLFVNYAWNGSNGFTSGVQNNVFPNAQLSDSGIYTVTISLPGCTPQSASASVQVIPKPATPQISYNAPLCTGDTLWLFSNMGQNIQHNWYGPNNFSDTNYIGSLPNVSISDSGVYYLSVSINGCSSDTAAIMVSVGEYPNTVVMPQLNPFCEGDSIVLSVVSQPGCTYVWTFPDGSTQYGNPTLIYADTSISGTVYLSITSPGGCTITDSLTLLVNPLPVVNIWNNGPICNNGLLLLFADTIAGASYSWTGPNGYTSTQQNPAIPNADTTFSGYYTVTVTDSNGCTYSTSTLAIISGNSLFVYPYYSGACAGDTLFLSAVCMQNVTYSWTGPNGFSSNQCNAFIPNASSFHNGVYTLTATLNNCTNNGESITVTINPNPVVYLGPDTTVCDTVAFLLNPGAFAWYEWQDYSNTSTYTVTMPGTYYVTVWDSNGCVASDTIEIMMVPCGGNFKITNVFTPNGDGINDFFIIRPEGVSTFTLRVLNRWGEVLYSGDENSQGWDGRTISGNMCVEGTYFYIFESENMNLTGFLTLFR